MASGLTKWDWRRPPAALVALAAMLAALAVNHAGYRGGGADDWPAVTIGTSLVYAASIPDLGGLEAPAGLWVREFGPALAVDDASRRFLTLVPGVRALPVDPPRASRYMIVALGSCAQVPRFQSGWRVERVFVLTTAGGEQASLCLFRRLQAFSSEA